MGGRDTTTEIVDGFPVRSALRGVIRSVRELMALFSEMYPRLDACRSNTAGISIRPARMRKIDDPSFTIA